MEILASEANISPLSVGKISKQNSGSMSAAPRSVVTLQLQAYNRDSMQEGPNKPAEGW